MNAKLERKFKSIKKRITKILTKDTKPLRQKHRTLFQLHKVAELLCERHGLLISEIREKTRKRRIVLARQEAEFVLVKAVGKSKDNNKGVYSLKQIGIFFGGQHHSTVIYSCLAVGNLIDTEPGYKGYIKGLFLDIDPNFDFELKGLEYLLEE